MRESCDEAKSAFAFKVAVFLISCCSPSGRLVLVLGVLVVGGDLGLRYLFLKYFFHLFVVVVVLVGSNCTVVGCCS